MATNLPTPAPPTLDEVYAEFESRLGHLGKVVIAGGAVRDTLLERTPKDFDVFVLDKHGVGCTEVLKADAVLRLADLDSPDDPKWLYGLSDGFTGTYIWRGVYVQIMFVDFATTEELLASFDWNITRYGFDGKIVTEEPIFYNKDGKPYLRDLILTPGNIRWPRSSMKRGMDFAKRYRLRLRRGDLLRLVDGILREQVERDKDR